MPRILQTSGSATGRKVPLERIHSRQHLQFLRGSPIAFPVGVLRRCSIWWQCISLRRFLHRWFTIKCACTHTFLPSLFLQEGDAPLALGISMIQRVQMRHEHGYMGENLGSNLHVAAPQNLCFRQSDLDSMLPASFFGFSCTPISMPLLHDSSCYHESRAILLDVLQPHDHFANAWPLVDRITGTL